MKTFASRLTLDHLTSGHGDAMACTLLQRWQSSAGLLNEDAALAGAQLVILDGTPQSADTPDILWCGSESLAAQQFGRTFAQSANAAKALLSRDYRGLCAQSYYDCAIGGMPVFDIVSAGRALTTSTSGVRYHRLLLPYSNGQGANYTLCYSFGLTTSATRSTGCEGSAGRRLVYSRENTSLHMPLLQAAPASVAHWNRIR